jgi:hypothetical protein
LNREKNKQSFIKHSQINTYRRISSPSVSADLRLIPALTFGLLAQIVILVLFSTSFAQTKYENRRIQNVIIAFEGTAEALLPPPNLN